MAALRALLTLLALAHAAAAERVVLCTSPCEGAQRLGRLDAGEVAAVGDAALLAHGWPVLYWSRDDHHAAMEGLSASDAQAALAARAATFAPHALDGAINRLAADARACAAHEARVGHSPTPALERFTRVRATARLDTMPEAALRARLVEAEAALAAELDDAAAAARRGAWEVAAAWATESAARLVDAREDGAALAALGHATYARALPRLEAIRVVYEAPADERELAALRARGEAVARFRQGALLPASASDVARRNGAVVMYLDRDQFLADLAATPAERERAFARRLRATGGGRAAYSERLLSLRLELRALLGACATNAGGAAAERLRQRLHADDAALAPELAASSPGPGACERFSADAALFVALARRAGRAALADTLARAAR